MVTEDYPASISFFAVAKNNLNEGVEKEMFTFLDALRDTGVTNMFGAGPYLSREFGLDKREAREILAKWMRSKEEESIEEMDMNDPVLMKMRASKMADEKEKAKQAALDKKYGSSFMDKLDAEISLKQELQDLKDEREQLMIDMQQEAEPEGREIA